MLWDFFVQEACSQQEHCLSHSHRECDGSRTLLDCPRTKSKGFIVGHHLHSRSMPLQLNFKLLKPASSSQGAGTCSVDYTARGGTPFSPV